MARSKEKNARNQLAWRMRQRGTDSCLVCAAPSAGKMRCEPCTKKHREDARKRRERYRAENRCASCGKDRGTAKNKVCPACIRRVRAKQSKRREVVLEHYGAACACCGELEETFLCVDHVNNDGAEHRKEIPGGNLYKWLIDHAFPPGFQILCFNCNMGKHINGGVCPHQATIRF